MLSTILSGTSSAAESPQALQRRLNAVAARMNGIESALATTKMKLAGLQRGVRGAEQKLLAARKGMLALTQGLYMGTMQESTAFFSAESLVELGDRLAYAEHLRAGDRDTLLRAAVAKRNLERRQRGVASILKKQNALAALLRAEQRGLAKLFREQQARERAFEAAQARRRGASARRRASRFEPRIVGGAGPFRVCPVDRPRAYSNDFGAPRTGHRHQGNDILAPRGTPIRAPFDGVFKRNSSGSGGLQARVFGSRGYVFNAHLDSYPSLANGASVTAGTIIGYVGDSGNARGGPTHNHFEWHPGGGRAVNPYPYLNLVC